MTWQVSGASDLPFGDRDREWDEQGARDRIFRWAGWEDHPEPEKARKAFFAYDDEKPTNLTAYKLPFADIVGGELQAMPRGLFAFAQLLSGARDGIDLPADVLREIRGRVTTYYHKMGEKAPWEEKPKGHEAMPGKLTAGKREKRVRAAHQAARTRQARSTQRTGSRKRTAQPRKKRTRAAPPLPFLHRSRLLIKLHCSVVIRLCSSPSRPSCCSGDWSCSRWAWKRGGADWRNWRHRLLQGGNE